MAVEEYETLRLIDYQGLTQEECARKMGVGRATVQAMYTEARKKTARFLAEGGNLKDPWRQLLPGGTRGDGHRRERSR